MKPLTLLKAARGAIGADEMLEMLSSMGINLTVTSLDSQQSKGSEFTELAKASIDPKAKVVKLSATLKGGEPLLAIMVLPDAIKALP